MLLNTFRSNNIIQNGKKMEETSPISQITRLQPFRSSPSSFPWGKKKGAGVRSSRSNPPSYGPDGIRTRVAGFLPKCPEACVLSRLDYRPDQMYVVTYQKACQDSSVINQVLKR